MRTTKPVPAKLKVLRGTYRKDRDGKGLKVPPGQEIPEPPDRFNKDQKALWQTVCTTLRSVDLLQPVGIPLLIIYCDQSRLYQEAFDEVKRSGMITTTVTKYGTVMKKNPALEVMNGAIKIMLAISDQFGFTPLAQSKIKGVARQEQEYNDGYDF
ncbi:MAG TPA: phage terminase small subunit P27 family [Saprospiraceae bacterium]|nr:phage terminase small subunit P27 family [Saprospiraceae bacterium]